MIQIYNTLIKNFYFIQIFFLPKFFRIFFCSQYLFFYVETLLKSKNFFLFPSSMFLLKKKKIFFFCLSVFYKFFKPLYSLYKNFFLNLLFGYIVELRVNGIGFRFYSTKFNNYLAFRIGYSHLYIFTFLMPIQHKIISEKKLRLLLFFWEKQKLLNEAILLKFTKPFDKYKLKGLSFYYDILQKKAIKKPE